MAILQYGYMALDLANMGVYQESNENVAIWSRHLIDQTFQNLEQNQSNKIKINGQA